MTKKKPCIVTITETRHRKQPFLVTIDKPGKAEPYQLKQRYSRKDAAMRGALRNLGAEWEPGGWVFYELINWYSGVRRPIKFVFNKKM